jgi:hypothetical protein
MCAIHQLVYVCLLGKANMGDTDDHKTELQL